MATFVNLRCDLLSPFCFQLCDLIFKSEKENKQRIQQASPTGYLAASLYVSKVTWNSNHSYTKGRGLAPYNKAFGSDTQVLVCWFYDSCR